MDPTFKRKMAVIGAAINEAAASPPHDYPRCRVFYFTRKIHDAVQVSCPFQNVSLPKLTSSFARNISNCTVCKRVQLHHLLQSSRRMRMRSWLPRLVPWTWMRTFWDLFTSPRVIHLTGYPRISMYIVDFCRLIIPYTAIISYATALNWVTF